MKGAVRQARLNVSGDDPRRRAEEELGALMRCGSGSQRSEDAEPRGAAAGPRQVYAALDLGTNNCRLLIATCNRGTLQVIDAFSRIVRLGEGLSRCGSLSEAAQYRAVQALQVCGERLRQYNVTHSRLIATEACRAAENGAHFIARVESECGLQLEVIDRETEARLAVLGCEPLFDRGCAGALLFDIGGGSTELAHVAGLQEGCARISSWTSLPIGVVSLAEKFGGKIVSEESFAAMVEHVARLIDAFPARREIAIAARATPFHLLGTSGTVTTIAGVHLGLRRYDRRRVDGLWMDSADVSEVVERLLSTDFQDRSRNPCIGTDRADLVLAGCAILEAIRDAFPARRLRIADRGLREGILVELMRAYGPNGRKVDAPPAWQGTSS